MKHYKWLCIAILLSALLGGCKEKEAVITMIPMTYSLDFYTDEQEGDVHEVTLSIPFYSTQEVTSAKVLSIEDIEGETLLDPFFMSMGWEVFQDHDFKEGYKLRFTIHLKKEHVIFHKIRVEINGKEYLAEGSYDIDYSHNRDEFIALKSNGISMPPSLSQLDIPEHAENFKLISDNELLTMEASSGFDDIDNTLEYKFSLQEPYALYATSLLLQYEVDGVAYRKYLPGFYGDETFTMFIMKQ